MNWMLILDVSVRTYNGVYVMTGVAFFLAKGLNMPNDFMMKLNKRIVFALNPFMPTYIILNWISMSPHGFIQVFMCSLFSLVDIYIYLLVKKYAEDDDDNPWNKLKKKIRQKITELNGKLVPVPA